MEQLPLSLLNDYLYCPRRAALKLVEGWRSANEHTLRGDIVHEHADLAGYEVARGVTLLRAVPVFSDRLGLNGRCDIIEVRPAEVKAAAPPSDAPGSGTAQESSFPNPSPRATGCRRGSGETLYPVEFKLGKRRKWDNDDVQLCAQALCLEEMMGVVIPRGAIYHASSKRRREVEFGEVLRHRTEETVGAVHELMVSRQTPPAVHRPACEECSLYDLCLPRLTGDAGRAERATRQLFDPHA